MANRYHRAPTRHWSKRRSSASAPARPSARAVSPRATKDGAKIPKNSNSQRISARAGTAGALLPDSAATEKKQAHVSAYVSEKNLRREPTGAALLTSNYVSRAAFVPTPHGGRMTTKIDPLTPESGRILP